MLVSSFYCTELQKFKRDEKNKKKKKSPAQKEERSVPWSVRVFTVSMEQRLPARHRVGAWVATLDGPDIILALKVLLARGNGGPLRRGASWKGTHGEQPHLTHSSYLLSSRR